MAQEINGIISELQDIDITLGVELSSLIEAVETLATEVRIAGGSDFIPGRRKAVELIQQYELMIKLDEKDLNKLLKENGNNYEAADVVEKYQKIEKYKNKIKEIVETYR